MARLCELKTPVGDALRFARMRVVERLSEPFAIELEAVGSKGDVDPKDILGRSLSIKVSWEDGVAREFSGYAVRFGAGVLEDGSGDRETWRYRISLRPWTWFLTRTSDCRIFQEMDTPAILDAVFEDEAAKDVDSRLSGSYGPREYCVQYRESDFDFVSRLMEQEGIGYFFEHANDRHTLVLVDGKATHASIDEPATIRYQADPARRIEAADSIGEWDAVEEVASGLYVLDEYDFKQPGTDMQVVRKPELPATHAVTGYEVFDYPGGYATHDEGEAHVAARIEALQTPRERYEGSGPLRLFHVGRRFRLEAHPTARHNAEYLITATDYDFEDSQYAAGDTSGADFRCRFSAIRANQQYRPPRATRRPVIPGIQTAVVTGPAGEEIHTDEYGRIKVQFHWDRYGRKDDRSSCWMRVAFLAAGPRFGFVSIPRIGHEVVVDFLEGDPDRPLVTGVVYNGANLPPWALPASKTQAGLYTRSSKGGGYDNANAIRFEDRKGAEQVWIHAEKNQDIEVENDETHWVGHDRAKTVDHDETVQVKHDRTETVGNNETITIGIDRTETVGANETIAIGADRKISVAASETATVALQRTHAVGVNETIAVGGAQEITIGAAQIVAIGAAQSVSVGLNQSTSVGANQSWDVGANQSTTVGANQTTSVSSNRNATVGGNDGENVSGDQSISVGKGRSTGIANDDALKVGKNLVIDAGDSIAFKTGSASITMKKDGTITIKGKDITIDGSGKINVKASGDVVIKGSKVLQN